MSPRLEGGCLCGAVRYCCSAPALFTAICHCKACQRQTGSAFSVIVGAPLAELGLTGRLQTVTTTRDLDGGPTYRGFCPACGSPVLARSGGLADVALLYAGTLDDTGWIAPELEVWGASAQPWVKTVPERPRHERDGAVPEPPA